MTSKRTFRASAAAALVVAVLSTACGDAAPAEPAASRPTPAASPTATPAPPFGRPSPEPRKPGGLTAPPPVTVESFGEAIELKPWTFCYESGCADGMPPADPPNVGNPEEVLVRFPLADWSFDAIFRPAGDECGREQTVDLEEVGDGEFLLRPAGLAGRYDVTLFGKGDGDLFVSFGWTTPADGPLPEPRARLALVTDHDGAIDSYGVELMVTNLAETPRKAGATITARSAEGNALTFEAKSSDLDCLPEGTVFWDGQEEKGLAVARLGDAPFTYEVELMLDGERYVGTAVWPDDEIRGNEPSARLRFEPPLPALGD